MIKRVQTGGRGWQDLNGSALYAAIDRGSVAFGVRASRLP